MVLHMNVRTYSKIEIVLNLTTLFHFIKFFDRIVLKKYILRVFWIFIN